MGMIITISAACLLLGYGIWQYELYPALKKPGKVDNKQMYIIIAMIVAFAVRLICAMIYQGHKTDMNCFNIWSSQVFENGISQFYRSESFHDYPPGYMYVLYVVGALKKLLGVENGLLYALIKMPAILCDMATGWLVYKLAEKKLGDIKAALVSGLYMFNPAVIVNSSLWGQVDSVYTLLVALMIYFVAQRKMILSYYIFALCIFIKPQALMFTPVLIFGIVENVFIPKFDAKKFFINLSCGLGAIAMIVVLALPFGLKEVIDQYVATIESYPHLTVNAFNLWGAMGQNWTDLIPATSIIGNIAIVAIVIYSVYLFFKSKSSAKYYFTGAFLSLATFTLSVKMHDRYAFPTMLLLLLAFIETKDIKTYTLYFINSVMQFFNVAWVLFVYEQDTGKHAFGPAMIIMSMISVATFVYFMCIAQKYYVGNRLVSVEQQGSNNKKTARNSNNNRGNAVKQGFFKTQILAKITKIDIIAMVVITAIYGAVALYNLGDMATPETEVNVAKKAVTVDMGAETEISKMKFFNGRPHLEDGRKLDVEFRNSDNGLIKKETYNSGAVFYWSEKSINAKARYVTFSTEVKDELNLKEVCFLDKDGKLITPVNAKDKSVAALFDEQELCPERTNFRNSTYFDEIYHARTAYEFIHKNPIYEWTHPPLGKLIMSLGILIFGMNPFGWRVAGTFIGILMVPVIYIFAKKMFKYSWLAAVTCLLFTFDFMHFAQTRIATIDVYVTFFIMLMYLFMFKYYTMNFYDTPFKKTLVPLALSGACMGLGVAAKWTGAYAGVGLAIIFFYTMYQRYAEYIAASKNRQGMTNDIPNKVIIDEFMPKFLGTIKWCLLFFVAIPLVIYCCSCIPYIMGKSIPYIMEEGSKGLKTVFINIRDMYAYHSKTVLDSTHGYSSVWHQWPVMIKPIWYYSGTVSNGVKEGISAFGNPIVWWTGIAALAYMIYLAIKKRDKIAIFLVISYFAQLVPWMAVERLTFIYHYFPCVPFVVLLIGYSIYCIYENAKNKKAVIIAAVIFAVAAIALFVLFYPVLSGQAISVKFAQDWLKWFRDWTLI